MQVKQNENGQWCIYGADGQVVSEHDSEEQARAALADLESQPAQATFLAGIDLKDLVTQNLASETEVQIALPGHYLQGQKEFDITLKDFADAERNFSAAANPLPVDYEHNTFVKGAQAPAAGWVKKVINRGEQGLYAVIAWTKSAAEHIHSGEYKFISPVFFFSARDTKTGAPIGTLLGPPALTNFPLIQGMQPVTAKRIDPIQKENSMFKKFLAALGIVVAEEPTQEKAVEIVKAKMTAPGALIASRGILATLELAETASEDEIKGKILALKHPTNMVPAYELVALQASAKKKDIEDLIDKAISVEAKMYPHEKDWALHADREWNKENNPALFKTFMAGRPKIMPIGDRLPGKKDDSGAVIDDVQAQVNKQMGVSAELFAKYNPAH